MNLLKPLSMMTAWTIRAQKNTAAARAVAHVASCREQGLDPTVPGADGADDTGAVRHEPDPAASAVHDRLQPVFEDAFSANVAICQALGS